MYALISRIEERHTGLRVCEFRGIPFDVSEDFFWVAVLEQMDPDAVFYNHRTSAIELVPQTSLPTTSSGGSGVIA